MNGWSIFTTPAAQGGWYAQALWCGNRFGEASGRSEPEAVEQAKSRALRARPDKPKEETG